MDRPRRATLGKRTRRNAAAEEVNESRRQQPKRSRTKGKQDDGRTPSTARSRSGLLTPEPSVLTESQDLTDRTDDKSSQIFPFMKLPAELRIHVYHMALHRYEPLFLHAERVPDKTDEDAPPSSPPWPSSPPPTVVVPQPETRVRVATPVPKREPLKDPIVPQILRLNKLIYKEARQVLYGENVFTLSLTSGVHTLSTLHQRSRSLIKHVILTIPSHHDILDGFADLVRLGLRYCWGLKSFKIILQATLPDDGRISGATSVYANAFHILRWLPRGCSVVLEGSVSETVKKVVAEEGRLQTVLDETNYLKRQHQMPERH
jgi:epsin